MFELNEGKVIVDPNKLAVPAFKKVWDSDKSKSKEQAFNYLAYVYYMCDYKSPYANYPDNKRHELICEQILKDQAIKIPQYVTDACSMYKQLNETSDMRLLAAWEKKIDELATYLTNNPIDLDNINAQLKSGVDMEKIIASKQKLKEVVEKQQMHIAKNRGGYTKSKYED